MVNKNKSIRKIAEEIGVEKSRSSIGDTKTALKVASELLKQAACKQRSSESEIDNLKSKIATLENEINAYKQEKLAEEKENKVCRIVNNMYQKGIIKKADTDIKKEEFQKLSMDALDAMETTVLLIPEKKSEEYVSDLTFIYGDNNIKEKDDMSASIKNFVNNHL